MSDWRIDHPPRAVRTAQLDNLVLIPASELPKKTIYQELANRFPRGQMLIVTPAGDERTAAILKKVASHLETKGQRVKTFCADSSGTLRVEQRAH
jgi:hypothetical protein